MNKIMRILIINFLLILSISCTMGFLDGFKFDNPKFENIEEACIWINENIEYRKIKGLKSPVYTINNRYGDCSTMSVLLMAIVAYQHINYCSNYVSCKSHVKDENHAVVEYQGKFYDCTKGEKIKIKERDILQRYNHYDIMWFVYNE